MAHAHHSSEVLDRFKMHWTKADTERWTVIKLKLEHHTCKKTMNANDIKDTIVKITNNNLDDFSDVTTKSINAVVDKRFQAYKPTP